MDLEEVVADLVQKVERRFYGKYRGFVVENADPEQLGRLKLTVPSVLGKEVVTGWATPCIPYGGEANQGLLFIPEKEAGVWVEFEEGDVEFPIWVGTFWSKPGGESELPKPNDADGTEQDSVQDPPTRKIIKTLKGHTIQFEDADGEEMVIIYVAEKGHVATMNGDGIKITDGVNSHEVVLCGDGITVTDGVNSHKVVLDGDGIVITDGVNSHEIVFDGDGIVITDGVNSGNVTSMTSDGITIESGSDVMITGGVINIEGDEVNITAQGALTAKGDETTVEAQSKLALKGQPVHLNPP